MNNLHTWLPCNPDSPFGIHVEVMLPMPALENLVCNLSYIFLFYFSFKKPNQTYVLLLQEDFDILLLIRPIKASNDPAAYSGHGGAFPFAV